MARPTIAEAPIALRTIAWADYGLVDSGGGRKLERYGPYRVVRPEPQCLWRPALSDAEWVPDATFDPADEEDTGRWRFTRKLPETWPLEWRGVRFKGRFTAFRHLGFFPEQAANWEWVDKRVKTLGDAPKILNLFGYTGVASLV